MLTARLWDQAGGSKGKVNIQHGDVNSTNSNEDCVIRYIILYHSYLISVYDPPIFTFTDKLYSLVNKQSPS